MGETTTVTGAVDATEGTLALFGHDPLWIVIVKTLLLFIFLVLAVLITIWAERRVVARMQQRIGPNRAGPFGLLQSLMDGFKLAFKEEIFPTAADKMVYIVAPIISVVPAYLAWAVIPFGPEVNLFGVDTPLQLTDLPVAILYILAITAIGIYGIVLAGWASGSSYPLLGGLRSSAQMISYEVALGLSFVGVFILAGSMSTSEIVSAQTGLWFGLLLLPSFAIFIVSMVGETNRAPFDLPEAESEIVGGFHTEYSTMKFALFFLAEYINMITVSAVAVTVFLGGWRAPWPISLWDGANEGYLPFVWFVLKVSIFIFMFIWLRGTLPRMRYDQFMRFGWKFLILVSVIWIMVIAIIRGSNNEYGWSEALFRGSMIAAGIVVLVIALSVLGANTRRVKRRQQELTPVPTEYDPFAGGFPVPPLPGQNYTPPASPVVSGQAAPRLPDGDDQSQEVRGG